MKAINKLFAKDKIDEIKEITTPETEKQSVVKTIISTPFIESAILIGKIIIGISLILLFLYGLYKLFNLYIFIGVFSGMIIGYPVIWKLLKKNTTEINVLDENNHTKLTIDIPLNLLSKFTIDNNCDIWSDTKTKEKILFCKNIDLKKKRIIGYWNKDYSYLEFYMKEQAFIKINQELYKLSRSEITNRRLIIRKAFQIARDLLLEIQDTLFGDASQIHNNYIRRNNNAGYKNDKT